MRDRDFKRVKDVRKFPVVQVTWVDSQSWHGWDKSPAAARGNGMAECISVGRLIRADRKQVNLVQSISEGGHLAEVLVIPRPNVRRIRVLGPKGRR